MRMNYLQHHVMWYILMCSLYSLFIHVTQCSESDYRTHIRRTQHYCEPCTMSLKPGADMPPSSARSFRFTDKAIQPWLTEQPYMKNTLGCGGTWFSGGVTYPSDAPLLSLGALGGWRAFDVRGAVETPANCLKVLSERCRMRIAYRLLLNITSQGGGANPRSMCHHSFNHHSNVRFRITHNKYIYTIVLI